jgi:hypothetical protein
MSPEGYKRISTCGNVECIYIKLSNVARGARGAYKTNPETTQIKTRAIRNFLRFDTTVAEMYPALTERHETIILEPDENNYSEKCSCCHERVANPWTGKCDVCILPKSNGLGKGFRYL